MDVFLGSLATDSDSSTSLPLRWLATLTCVQLHLACSQYTMVFCRSLVPWWDNVVAWRKRKEAMLSVAKTIATKEMLAAHLLSCIW